MTALAIIAILVVFSIFIFLFFFCTLDDQTQDVYYPEQDSLWEVCLENKEEDPCDTVAH